MSNVIQPQLGTLFFSLSVWSLGHAELLLFSWLGWKLFGNGNFKCFWQQVGTKSVCACACECLTTTVLMCRLANDCLSWWHAVICQMLNVDPCDMLNKFCFHVCAQKSPFIGENGNVFLYFSFTLSCGCTNHRAGSQLKMSHQYVDQSLSWFPFRHPEAGSNTCYNLWSIQNQEMSLVILPQKKGSCGVFKPCSLL